MTSAESLAKKGENLNECGTKQNLITKLYDCFRGKLNQVNTSQSPSEAENLTKMTVIVTNSIDEDALGHSNLRSKARSGNRAVGYAA